MVFIYLLLSLLFASDSFIELRDIQNSDHYNVIWETKIKDKNMGLDKVLQEIHKDENAKPTSLNYIKHIDYLKRISKELLEANQDNKESIKQYTRSYLLMLTSARDCEIWRQKNNKKKTSTQCGEPHRSNYLHYSKSLDQFTTKIHDYLSKKPGWFSSKEPFDLKGFLAQHNLYQVPIVAGKKTNSKLKHQIVNRLQRAIENEDSIKMCAKSWCNNKNINNIVSQKQMLKVDGCDPLRVCIGNTYSNKKTKGDRLIFHKTCVVDPNIVIYLPNDNSKRFYNNSCDLNWEEYLKGYQEGLEAYYHNQPQKSKHKSRSQSSGSN